jgi:NhaP-type Na+/H+ or K+/H+ antiporter
MAVYDEPASVSPAQMSYGVIVCGTAFAFLYCAAGKDGSPGGSLFSLLLLFVVCWSAGELGKKVFKLPELVGMLLAGVLLRNTGAIEGLPSAWMSVLKGAAEAVIMLRAGMGLDFAVIRASGPLLCSLALLPGLVEALVAAFVSQWLFASYTLDLKWGLLLGFVLSDVSPAVTVPLLLDFILKGYGKTRGIPSILLAASGFNGVVSITFFGIMMNFVFSTDEPTWLVCVLGGVQIVGGLLAGYLAGRGLAATWRWAPGEGARFGLMLLQACLGIFLGKKLKMSGGGTLAVVVAGIVVKGELGVSALQSK